MINIIEDKINDKTLNKLPELPIIRIFNSGIIWIYYDDITWKI